jgi:hypothetical protein
MRTHPTDGITCDWLPHVVVMGLLAKWLTRTRRVDSRTSPGVVWFVAKEAHEASLGS